MLSEGSIGKEVEKTNWFPTGFGVSRVRLSRQGTQTLRHFARTNTRERRVQEKTGEGKQT
jgi:hypothetical protein